METGMSIKLEKETAVANVRPGKAVEAVGDWWQKIVAAVPHHALLQAARDFGAPGSLCQPAVCRSQRIDGCWLSGIKARTGQFYRK
jgi:hypothetical protein